MSKMTWLGRQLEDLSDDELRVATDQVAIAMDAARAAYQEDLDECHTETRTRGLVAP